MHFAKLRLICRFTIGTGTMEVLWEKNDVLKAGNIIKEKGPELGLFANMPKCELISAPGSDGCFKQFEQEMTRVTDGNMSILGSPIGSQFHCSSWVSDKLSKKMPLLIKKLQSLDDAQSSFLLLQNVKSILTMVLNCFEFLLGSGLSEQSLIQANLERNLVV